MAARSSVLAGNPQDQVQRTGATPASAPAVGRIAKQRIALAPNFVSIAAKSLIKPHLSIFRREPRNALRSSEPITRTFSCACGCDHIALCFRSGTSAKNACAAQSAIRGHPTSGHVAMPKRRGRYSTMRTSAWASPDLTSADMPGIEDLRPEPIEEILEYWRCLESVARQSRSTGNLLQAASWLDIGCVTSGCQTLSPANCKRQMAFRQNGDKLGTVH